MPEPDDDSRTEEEPKRAEDADVTARFGASGRPFAKTPFHYGLYAGLGLLTAYIVYLSIEILMPLLIVIVVAAFLAIGLNPVVRRMQRWGMPRGGAVGMVVLMSFLVLCGGIVAIVPPVINEGTEFITNLPDLIERLSHQRWLVNIDRQFDVLGKVREAAEGVDANTVVNAAGGVFSVLGVAVGGIFNGFMIALLTIYFLVSFDRLSSGFYRLLPAHRRTRAKALGDEILAKVGGYTVGALGIAATAGASSFVFMLLAGIPYAYALAFVVAILDLIPQIGATLGAVVVTLVGLTVSLWVAIACAIFFIVYQQVENWIVYPTVMRKSVKVSDLAAILGLLLGASLMGVVGALLAVPTVAAVQLLVREVYIPRQDQI